METNISLYQNLTIIFGIAGGIMLVLSIVLFIIFDMKHIIGKTLGLSEKQAIKRMNLRAKAEEKARKKKRALAAEGGRDDKTAAVSNGTDGVGGRKQERPDVPIAEAKAAGAAVNMPTAGPEAEDEATDVLAAEPGAEDEATDVLAAEPGAEDEATDVLAAKPGAEDEATDVLAVSEKGISGRAFTDAPAGWEPIETGDTTVLNENPATAVLSANHPTIKNTQFMLIRHIMLLHTEEII